MYWYWLFSCNELVWISSTLYKYKSIYGSCKINPLSIAITLFRLITLQITEFYWLPIQIQLYSTRIISSFLSVCYLAEIVISKLLLSEYQWYRLFLKVRILFKLSYIFLAKQEISEAYTNVPAKTHVHYFISMSVCLSVVLCHIFVYGCLREL